MKSFFTKILSFFLSVSILFATSSFSVNSHFCCNKLVDIAIFGNAKVCKDKISKSNLPTKQCSSFQEKDCCSDHSFVKTGDDTIKKVNDEFQAETKVYLNSFFYTSKNLLESLAKNIVSFEQYRPPLLCKDIQVLQETFLI